MDKSMLDKAKSSQGAAIGPRKPSCALCGHLQICAVYRAVKPLLGNWPDDQRPFEAEDMAAVCNAYAEQFISIRQSNGGDESASVRR